MMPKLRFRYYAVLSGGGVLGLFRSSRKRTKPRTQSGNASVVTLGEATRSLSVTLAFSNINSIMSSSSGSDPRRYGFSCSVCRRRKVRCDGARPVCRNCSKSGVECMYKPESGDLRLLQQIQRANKRVLELEEQLKKLSLSGGKQAASLPEIGVSPVSTISPDSSAETKSAKDAQSDEEDVRDNAFAKLGVDENGEVKDLFCVSLLIRTLLNCTGTIFWGHVSILYCG